MNEQRQFGAIGQSSLHGTSCDGNGFAAQGYVGGGKKLSGLAPSDYGACEAQRQAEIPHQLERLGRTLEGCLKGLEVLSMKLESSVMRCEPPSTVGCDNAITAGPTTPYGSRLHDFASMAANINARIESLTARLEV
jgi:hypothetical protein